MDGYILVNKLRSYPEPRRSLGVLLVEQQLTLFLYFLKDQGSISITVNITIVRNVCATITQIMAPRHLKSPNSDRKMTKLVMEIEYKYGFPQGFGCIDGEHVATIQPPENLQDYFSNKQKYTKNMQAVRDCSGRFIGTESKWLGSVYDGGKNCPRKKKSGCRGSYTLVIQLHRLDIQPNLFCHTA